MGNARLAERRNPSQQTFPALLSHSGSLSCAPLSYLGARILASIGSRLNWTGETRYLETLMWAKGPAVRPAQGNALWNGRPRQSDFRPNGPRVHGTIGPLGRKADAITTDSAGRCPGLGEPCPFGAVRLPPRHSCCVRRRYEALCFSTRRVPIHRLQWTPCPAASTSKPSAARMNVLDSELVAAALVEAGHQQVDSLRRADTVLLNTCSVRQHAEDKIYSALGRLGLPRSNAPR